MSETEAQFQKAVIELARLLNWKCAHFRPARTKHGWRTPVAADGKGFVDLVLVRERVIWAEVKRDKGKLRSEQEQWRQALTAAGQEWYCWRPSDWDQVVETLTRREAVPAPIGMGRGA